VTARVLLPALAALAGLAAARLAHAKGCHEGSDVVGYHHCSWFGTEWSRDAATPRVSVELAHYFRHFEADPFTLGGPALATSPSDFHATSSGVVWRVLVGFGPVVYTGVEVDGGGLDSAPRPVGTQVGESFEVAPYAVVGAHLYERYRVVLSTELEAGLRYDEFAACNMGDCPDVSQTKADVQARIRADIFFHPHLSLAIGWGESLVDSNERIFTLGVSLHGRSMDGMY